VSGFDVLGAGEAMGEQGAGQRLPFVRHVQPGRQLMPIRVFEFQLFEFHAVSLEFSEDFLNSGWKAGRLGSWEALKY
jgi:hypothetical protein